MDRDKREQERPLLKVRSALGKPFYEHCSELRGENSDWLFSQLGSRSAATPFKKQFSDGLLEALRRKKKMKNEVDKGNRNAVKAQER